VTYIQYCTRHAWTQPHVSDHQSEAIATVLTNKTRRNESTVDVSQTLHDLAVHYSCAGSTNTQPVGASVAMSEHLLDARGQRSCCRVANEFSSLQKPQKQHPNQVGSKVVRQLRAERLRIADNAKRKRPVLSSVPTSKYLACIHYCLFPKQAHRNQQSNMKLFNAYCTSPPRSIAQHST